MSLKKIRKCLKEVEDNVESLAWCEEEVINLLSAVAEHILALGEEHETVECNIPESALTVRNFVATHGLISENRLYWLVRNDESFRHQCVIRGVSGNFVKPKETLEYLKNRPYFKKLLVRLDKFKQSC
jgi:hypothetical protein